MQVRHPSHALLDGLIEGCQVISPDWRYLYLNDAAVRQARLPREALIGRTMMECFPGIEATALAADIRRCLAEGVRVRRENEFAYPDGTTGWFELRIQPVPEGVFILSLDITALKSSADVARRADEARSRLAAIVEFSNDAIISRDLVGNVTAWNHAAERLFGYRADEIVGRPSAVLIPPDCTQEDVDIGRAIARGEVLPQYETRRVRKDGSVIEVSIVTSPIRDAHGQISGSSKTVRDLTKQRAAEKALSETEAQLRQAQKMEAIGSLAGGIAHDFNNILSVIMSFTSMAIDDLPPADPLRADLGEVLSASQRAAGLTRRLLAFSRQQVIDPVVHDLNDTVRGVEKMLRRLVGEDIEFTVLAGADLFEIFVDPGEVEQVLMNLVVNARDAMADGGRLLIETSNVHLDAAYAEAHHGVTAGNYVLLAVTDTGMDAATKVRIFDPFFTTKGPGKGTGLGLSTVYGIVKQSGGNIWVYSEPGHGTTFKVYFPQAAGSATISSPPRSELATESRGTETVLLVEDEEPVRAAMRAILQKAGYAVLEAANGGEALLLAEQHAEIHLLLTDVIMPRMNGRQLAERMLALRPGLPVLFVSGYTQNSIVQNGVLEAGFNYLAKPITPSTLSRKVREVLDARAATIA